MIAISYIVVCRVVNEKCLSDTIDMSALNAQGAWQRKAALQGLTLGETRNEVATQTVACNVSSITGNLTH